MDTRSNWLISNLNNEIYYTATETTNDVIEKF